MKFSKEALSRLPNGPGVYIFKNNRKTVLYVGKAVNLKNRVSQYLTRDAIGEKTALLVGQIEEMEYFETAYELDALLLEAQLIRTYLPKYNVIARDDKSPLYIVITTSQVLPEILFVRKNQLSRFKKKDTLFGPFQSSAMARGITKQLRYIIPFCTSKTRNGKPCFYTQLGLCNPCPSSIVKLKNSPDRTYLTSLYRKNIFRLRDILSGKSPRVMKTYELEMKNAAFRNDFERAVTLRDQIAQLQKLLEKRYSPHIYTQKSQLASVYQSELTELLRILTSYFPGLSVLNRIECIDISNTYDQFAAGSLVVMTGGVPDRSQYRRFRIKKTSAPNDAAMISEIIIRRMKHSDWPYPDILIVDGGKPQVSAASKAIELSDRKLPVIGLAKRFEEIVIPKPQGGFTVVRLPYNSPALHLLQRIRDEAHRFALRYNRTIRSKQFLPT